MRTTTIKATEVSADFVTNHETGLYNLAAWKKKVAGYMQYKDVKWYFAEPQNGYDYARFFVEYTVGEGLRFMNSFSFASSLSNNGFKRAFFLNGEIFTKGFGEDGSQGVVNNKEGRKWLVDNICKHGIAVTNCL